MIPDPLYSTPSEFVIKCRELEELVDQNQPLGVVVKYRHFWLGVTKSKSQNIEEISKFVERFFTSHLRKKGFTYSGDLWIKLSARWRQYPESCKRMKKLIASFPPNFESMKQTMNAQYEEIGQKRENIQDKIKDDLFEEKMKLLEKSFNEKNELMSKAIETSDQIIEEAYQDLSKKINQIFKFQNPLPATHVMMELRKDLNSVDCSIRCASKEVVKDEKPCVEEQIVMAHKCLIEGRFTLFKRANSLATLTPKAYTYDLSNFDKEIVELFLDYIYFGQLQQISLSQIFQLYALADYLDEIKITVAENEKSPLSLREKCELFFDSILENLQDCMLVILYFSVYFHDDSNFQGSAKLQELLLKKFIQNICKQPNSLKLTPEQGNRFFAFCKSCSKSSERSIAKGICYEKKIGVFPTDVALQRLLLKLSGSKEEKTHNLLHLCHNAGLLIIKKTVQVIEEENEGKEEAVTAEHEYGWLPPRYFSDFLSFRDAEDSG